jgi:hypothetical protein
MSSGYIPTQKIEPILFIWRRICILEDLVLSPYPKLSLPINLEYKLGYSDLGKD